MLAHSNMHKRDDDNFQKNPTIGHWVKWQQYNMPFMTFVPIEIRSTPNGAMNYVINSYQPPAGTHLTTIKVLKF